MIWACLLSLVPQIVIKATLSWIDQTAWKSPFLVLHRKDPQMLESLCQRRVWIKPGTALQKVGQKHLSFLLLPLIPCQIKFDPRTSQVHSFFQHYRLL